MTLKLIEQAIHHGQKVAIVTPNAQFTYADLLQTSAQIANHLLQGPADLQVDLQPDLQEQRVAFLMPAGFEYVATQWAIWRSGGIAVPLCTVHPEPELAYVIDQSEATIVVAHPSFADRLSAIVEQRSLRFILSTEAWPSPLASLPDLDPDRRALILYTSGTTGKPKGVVLTHRNIQAQVSCLVEAWDWQQHDRILHVLPLHHIHGIINVLTCALWVGAECHMLPKFEAQTVWNHIAQGDLTLFMAVPTIYAKLIAAWNQESPERQAAISAGCAQMRLMVSGSAALPVQILEQWQRISDHFLLERYGMTEIGMALSNPLQGQRQAGKVGQPLPTVQVRLVEEGVVVGAGHPGELQIKGPNVFLEYWRNPEATAKSFQNGWFCTGDRAVLEDGAYRILGRISTDIIKTGGYKVSALEIEEVLRNHPLIQECAVVGVPDQEWGERVCAALVLVPETDLSLEDLRTWTKQQLATYKVPARLSILQALPRNAMGKVIKPAIVAQVLTQFESS